MSRDKKTDKHKANPEHTIHTQLLIYLTDLCLKESQYITRHPHLQVR